MNRSLLTLLLLAVSAQAGAAMLPGNSLNGKKLHDQNCVSCHTTRAYTRPDHRVQSVEGLIGQVNGCVRQIGLKLDRDQVNDIVRYLDESFYRFK